jgi:hypothetical protein
MDLNTGRSFFFPLKKKVKKREIKIHKQLPESPSSHEIDKREGCVSEGKRERRRQTLKFWS